MVRLRVRELAEERGWTAAKLGRKADISNSAIYGIWNGITTDPGIQTLAAIAGALGVRISDLYEEVGDAPAGQGIIEESIEALVPTPAL